MRPRLIFILAALISALTVGIWLAARQPRVAVLAYHDVYPNPRSPYSITPARLQEDLQWFLSHGWQPLSLDDFRAWEKGGRKLEKNSFLVTFDDGYESLITYAAPVLERLQVPAASFLITGELDLPVKEGEAPKLASSQVKALNRSGLISFGSHSNSLHGMIVRKDAAEPAVYGVTRERLGSDLQTSKQIITSLTGSTPYALAWPHGRAPAWAGSATRQYFELVFGGGEVFARQGEAYNIPRFTMEWRTQSNLRRQFLGLGRVRAVGQDIVAAFRHLFETRDFCRYLNGLWRF